MCKITSNDRTPATADIFRQKKTHMNLTAKSTDMKATKTHPALRGAWLSCPFAETDVVTAGAAVVTGAAVVGASEVKEVRTAVPLKPDATEAVTAVAFTVAPPVVVITA